MIDASQLPKNAAELQQLQQQNALFKKQEVCSIAIQILELFGLRYANVIMSQIKEPIKRVFQQVYNSFIEIQNRLKMGESNYVSERCCQTKGVLENFPMSANQIKLFKEIKMASYGLWPFPQTIILQYANPDLAALEKLEVERDRGFFYLIDELDPQIKVEDEKEEVPQRLPASEACIKKEIAATKLYFRTGACVFKEKIVFFSDLVQMWAKLAERNEAKRTAFLERLNLKNWVEDTPNKVAEFLEFEPEERSDLLTFQSFSARSAVVAVKSNLGLKKLLPSARDELIRKFMRSERIRADLCYFSAYRALFYNMDFRLFNRYSATLIRSFQLYFFIARNFGVPEEDLPALLNVTLFMSESWKEDRLPSFGQRAKNLDISDGDKEAFRIAWEGMHQILNKLAKREISFSNPSLEDEKLFDHFTCWNLLFFLWQHPRRDAFIQILCHFAELPNFSMTLSTVFDFCKINQECLASDMVEFFTQKYRETIGELEENGVHLEDTQYLFFNPPLPISQQNENVFGFVKPRTKEFIEKMAPYQFPIGEEYSHMLRKYILLPQIEKFSLLEDCQAIGANPTRELLFEVLSKDLVPFNPEPEDQHKIAARSMTKKIQDKYQFSDVQIFSIYIEITRLITQGQADIVIGKISQAVHDLARLCPALKKEMIYFLFRYHPNVEPEQVAQLAAKRSAWAGNEMQLKRVAVSREIYADIIKQIDAFVTPLSKASTEEGPIFLVECQRALLSAFFPPLQPLMNFFRISCVMVDGIRWGEEIWKTHEGQLKFILKQADVGIYFHWSIWKDRPVFFMSFFNIQTRSAFSAFIPINISVTKAIPPEGQFWGLLSTLSQIVLKEETDKDLLDDAPDTPDSWMLAFAGAKEAIKDFANVEPLWEFFRRVKLSYRNLFLSSVAGRKLDNFPSFDRFHIAAQGHIFSSHPRGSLLPQSRYEIQAHPEWFIPDAPDGSDYSLLFSAVTQEPISLNLDLNTAYGNIPISYHVQTAEGFVGMDVKDSKNELIADEIDGKYIILSIDGIKIPLRYPPEAFDDKEMFSRYFDYHNLLLKSAYYFTRSLE